MRWTTSCLTVLAALELAAAAAAQPSGEYDPNQPGPVTITDNVRFNDLDLSLGPGQRELSRRVSDKARELCDELGQSTYVSLLQESCVGDSVRNAHAQSKIAVAQSKIRLEQQATAHTATEAARPAAASEPAP